MDRENAERLREALYAEKLTQEWLVLQLNKRGYDTTKVSVSRMFTGQRDSFKTRAMLKEAQKIFDTYKEAMG